MPSPENRSDGARVAQCSLESRVAFLSDPRSHAPGTQRVEAIETHLSWIFLTERHAYKLKKPQRFDHYDLASVDARRRHCEMELRLNRRLSEGVYLDAGELESLFLRKEDERRGMFRRLVGL